MPGTEFTIQLEGTDGLYNVNVCPLEAGGMMRFRVTAPPGAGGSRPAWDIEIEPGCDHWQQCIGSAGPGPAMPCFLIEEIGEQIEHRLKDL